MSERPHDLSHLVERAVELGREAVSELSGATADPRVSLAAAHALRRAADHLVEELVVAARADGSTWADVGALLGVSTQAAHQRYRFAGRHGRPVLHEAEEGA